MIYHKVLAVSFTLATIAFSCSNSYCQGEKSPLISSKNGSLRNSEDYVRVQQYVDSATFCVLNEQYAKDKFHAYYYACLAKMDGCVWLNIKGADVSTFTVLDDMVAKDRNAAYYFDLKTVRRIKLVDAGTLKYREGYYYDKDFLYNCVLKRIAKLDTFDVDSFFNYPSTR